jgi:hypothetical protein
MPALSSTISTQFTTISPRFYHQKNRCLVPEKPAILAETAIETGNKPITHHSSPQNPKIDFFHNQMVGPPLLTSGLRRKTLVRYSLHHPVCDPLALK